MVHNLLGMLYKEDDTSIALKDIIHARTNLNKSNGEIPSGLMCVIACQKEDTHFSIIKGGFEGG